MKKIAIILVCMLVCFSLFTGCTDQKKGGDQDTNVGNSVEFDDTDIDVDTETKPGAETILTVFPCQTATHTVSKTRIMLTALWSLRKSKKIPVSHRFHIGFIYVPHGGGTLVKSAAAFEFGGFRR